MNIYEGWIKQAWRKEDLDLKIIKLQKAIIIILCVTALILATGWLTAPSRIAVYIPPDIQNGATLKLNSIPEPLIYSFAYEIWQELNYWETESGEDYEKNIKAYSAYLSPEFKTELLNENKILKSSGQVQRIRQMQGLSGAAYDPAFIKKTSSNTWQVDLKMRLIEFKNNLTIKDVEILYPLKIYRTNISPQHNPYGLAIAGFASEPRRVKSTI